VVRFVIRRLLGLVIILWIVSLVTFLIFFMVPKALGSNPAVLFAGRSPSAAALEGVTQKLGLNDPILVQYWHFLSGIFVGRHFNSGPSTTYCPPPCLGYSFKNNQPVWQEITSALPITISLAIGAAVIWLIAGVTTGIISALKPGSIFDRAAMGIALAGVSLPIYFTGLIALTMFSYGQPFTWLPNVHYVSFTSNPISWARNLILPCICLAFLYAALYARLTRASMIETMGEDYVRTARAKGLPEHTVITRHGLRAALTPIVTIFGLDLGGLLGGAVLTETVFGFNGIGKLAINSIGDQDLPVVLGVTMFAAFFIVVANLIVDILYAVVDPRVRLN
jgi:peptide/nickel transport system permease protein